MGDFEPTRRAVLPLLGLPLLAPAGAQAFEEAAGWADQRDARAALVRRELEKAVGTKLVLLGTGAGPVAGRARQMASSLIVRGAKAHIVDFGLGVTDLFMRTGVPFRAVESIFLTHHHPDHNIEYGPFLLLGWLRGLPRQLAAYGPPPLAQMTTDYVRAMAGTTAMWARDFHLADFSVPPVHEIPASGAVLQTRDLTVRAVAVDHPPVDLALAYRFDFPDRSIVFSGDTRASDNLTALAAGADILVHEAIHLPGIERQAREQVAGGLAMAPADFVQHIARAHTPIGDVGKIAQRAGVGTLVLSHIYPDDVAAEVWRDEAAKVFKGDIIVASDLTIV